MHFGYRAVAAQAVKSAERSAHTTRVSGAFRPLNTEMPIRLQSVLNTAINDVLDSASVTPVHSTPSRWIPSMLNDGFGWPRFRAADGYEPYEAKLTQWGAMAAHEKSEDILFANLRVHPHAANGIDELVGMPLNGQYGNAHLLFDPSTLVNATIFPAVLMHPYSGARAATIEHLPAVIGARIAGDFGYLSENIGAYYRDLSLYRKGELRYAESRAMRPALIEAMSGTRNDRSTWLASKIDDVDFEPIEAHLRNPVPDDVRAVVVREPTIELDDGIQERFVLSGKRLSELDATLPGRLSSVEDLMPVADLHAVNSAARTKQIPIAGDTSHHAVHDALSATPREVIRITPERPTAQIKRGDVVVVNETGVWESAATAEGTAELHRAIADRKRNPIPDTGGKDTPIPGHSIWM